MRNKKKIIRVVTVSNSIDFFKEVMVKQKAEGYETVVVTSPGQFLDDFRTEHPDFKTIEVPMERHISLVKDTKALLKMIWVLLKEKPYVVHSMTPKAGLLSMVAAKLTGVHVRIHTFTGLVWPSLVGKKRTLLMTTDKILCACATNIIPEGIGVLNDLKNNGVCKKHMQVLGYGNVMGVDMERFNPKRFNIKKDISAFNFLFIGRVSRDKGVNELVEAFTRLQKTQSNITLTLIGGNEKSLDPVSDATEKQIEENPGINYVGTKFNDELVEYYVKTDCFVMPSYREGFPNTVLEAGAMGLPQIVTDINGSREIITGEVSEGSNEFQKVSGGVNVSDGFKEFQKVSGGSLKICKNGIIVPSKNADALYEAMKLMIENQVMREQMAKNARPMIESRFEKSFVQSCQIEFYKEILG